MISAFLLPHVWGWRMILGSGLLTSSWPKASDWLIRDEFTDTRAAGSVNGTAATPGPGTRAVTDTGNKLSIGSDVATIATAVSAYNPIILYDQLDRACGLGLMAKLSASAGRTRVGWRDLAATSSEIYAMELDSAQARVALPGVASVSGTWSPSYGTTYRFAIVLRSANNGAFFAVKGGAFSQWTLSWISSTGAYTTAVPTYTAITTSDAGSADYLRVIQLPAPFDTDTGLATDVHSGSVAQGTTFTHEADFVLEFTVDTLPSSGNMWVFFRRAGSDNFWWLIIGPTGTFLLYEKNAGVSTERARANNVVANGHRIVVVAEGTTIKAYYNNTLAWSYAGAANVATATAGKVDTLGAGGAVSDLITWPRTLGATAATAQAASILNKVSA